ncbi:hypothetical protein Syun_020957 [Stephania yunnanensis]|uniref:Ribonuclease H1 N-terminal domain-containing protein n=1 Tax=Stephania yunnanensis TaxID=152371 RepID=A0AAP0NQI8_9MAGN
MFFARSGIAEIKPASVYRLLLRSPSLFSIDGRRGSEEEEGCELQGAGLCEKERRNAKPKSNRLDSVRTKSNQSKSIILRYSSSVLSIIFSNWKWYTVFCGWDPGVYGTWYECYKQGINFNGFHYAHFDTKEEAIAGFDRYNHAATIEREVHDQLTLEEGLAELGEIPPPPLPPRMWIEELYEAKGVPLARSPSIDEEPRIDLFPRDRTLYQKVGSGYEPVMEPWWSD